MSDSRLSEVINETLGDVLEAIVEDEVERRTGESCKMQKQLDMIYAAKALIEVLPDDKRVISLLMRHFAVDRKQAKQTLSYAKSDSNKHFESVIKGTTNGDT